MGRLQYKHSKTIDEKLQSIQKYLFEKYGITCMKNGKHGLGEEFYFLKPNGNAVPKKGCIQNDVFIFLETTSYKVDKRDYDGRDVYIRIDMKLKGLLNERNEGRITPEFNDNFNYEFHHFLYQNITGRNKEPYVLIYISEKELELFDIEKDTFFQNTIDTLYKSYLSINQQAVLV